MTNASSRLRAAALTTVAVAALLTACGSDQVQGTAMTSGSTTPAITTVTAPTVTSDPSEPVVPELADITYEWNSGSVPPPYNHKWQVELTGTTVTVLFEAGYVDDPEARWTDTFEVSAEDAADYRATVAALIADFREPADDDRAVGGHYGVLAWTTVDGTEESAGIGDAPSTEALDDTMIALSRALVPAGVLEGMEAEYDRWVEQQDG